MQAVLPLLVLSLLPCMLACTISETNAGLGVSALFTMDSMNMVCYCLGGVVSNCAAEEAEITDVTLTLGFGSGSGTARVFIHDGDGSELGSSSTSPVATGPIAFSFTSPVAVPADVDELRVYVSAHHEHV